MSGVISPYLRLVFWSHFSGAFFGLGVLLGLNYGARMLGFEGGCCFPKDVCPNSRIALFSRMEDMGKWKKVYTNLI